MLTSSQLCTTHQSSSSCAPSHAPRPTSPTSHVAVAVSKTKSSSATEQSTPEWLPASMKPTYQAHPNRFKRLGHTLFYFDNDELKATELSKEERKAERDCFKAARAVLPQKSRNQQGIKFTGAAYELKRKGAHRKIRIHSTPTEVEGVKVQVFNRLDYK